MSLVDYLLESRAPLDLARELAATAKENAALRNEVFLLKHENFWLKAADPIIKCRTCGGTGRK